MDFTAVVQIHEAILLVFIGPCVISHLVILYFLKAVCPPSGSNSGRPGTNRVGRCRHTSQLNQLPSYVVFAVCLRESTVSVHFNTEPVHSGADVSDINVLAVKISSVHIRETSSETLVLTVVLGREGRVDVVHVRKAEATLGRLRHDGTSLVQEHVSVDVSTLVLVAALVKGEEVRVVVRVTDGNVVTNVDYFSGEPQQSTHTRSKSTSCSNVTAVFRY